MQRNSTSTIIRRTLLVVMFAITVNLVARLAWHLQLFGYNTVGANCRIEEVTPEGSSWTYSYETCDQVRDTNFFEYVPLSDTPAIIATHIIGLLVAIVIFLVIHWIVGSGTKRHKLTCENESCLCSDHLNNNETFDAARGVWVYAQ